MRDDTLVLDAVGTVAELVERREKDEEDITTKLEEDDVEDTTTTGEVDDIDDTTILDDVDDDTAWEDEDVDDKDAVVVLLVCSCISMGSPDSLEQVRLLQLRMTVSSKCLN